MYVNNIKIKNYGSIEEFEINANLNEDGSPKPIILMGKNGSGKTLLLSQIIQAILLYKSDKYNEMPEKDKNQLYKVMSTSYIKNDKEESFVSVSFDNKKYNYVEIMSKNPNNTIENNSYPDYTSKLRNNAEIIRTVTNKQLAVIPEKEFYDKRINIIESGACYLFSTSVPDSNYLGVKNLDRGTNYLCVMIIKEDEENFYFDCFNQIDVNINIPIEFIESNLLNKVKNFFDQYFDFLNVLK